MRQAGRVGPGERLPAVLLRALQALRSRRLGDRAVPRPGAGREGRARQRRETLIGYADHAPRTIASPCAPHASASPRSAGASPPSAYTGTAAPTAAARKPAHWRVAAARSVGAARTGPH